MGTLTKFGYTKRFSNLKSILPAGCVLVVEPIACLFFLLSWPGYGRASTRCWSGGRRARRRYQFGIPRAPSERQGLAPVLYSSRCRAAVSVRECWEPAAGAVFPPRSGGRRAGAEPAKIGGGETGREWSRDQHLPSHGGLLVGSECVTGMKWMRYIGTGLCPVVIIFQSQFCCCLLIHLPLT